MAALSCWKGSSKNQPKDLLPWAGRPALLIGRVVGYPVGRPGGDSFLLRLRWVQPSGAPAFRSEEKVGVFRKNPQESFSWGDMVSVWGPLMGMEEGRGWGGVSARLFVPEGRSSLLHRVSPFNPIRWASVLRDRFHKTFKKHLPESANHLLCGVLLGDRPPGLEAFGSDFRRSGTYHLLVASGSNVGFAIGVWWLFSRWALWWPRRWTIAAVPFISFLYAFMAGGDPPVLRAAVMASVGSLGTLLGRRDRMEHALILSAGILLLWDPTNLYQAGFQMSYAATLAIAVVWGRRGLEREGSEETLLQGTRWWGKGRKWVGDLFVTSFSAQIALAPLLLYYFGRISWVGIGANMVAVPLSGLCLSLGAGLVFFESVWPAAAFVWAVPTRWAAESLAGWAHLCAKMPGAEWHLILNGPQAILLAIGIAIGFAALYFKQRRIPVIFILSAVVLASVWGLSTPKPPVGLEVSWTGGRNHSVGVRTTKEITVIRKGELSRADRVLVDGGHWVEGETRWEVVRPSGGEGFALRLISGKTRAFLNFGLTVRQQSAFVRSAPGPVDLLSWVGGKGGPPKAEVLALLNPRWIVYPGPRIPRSVRQSGVAVYRPRRAGLHWRTDPSFTGFDPSD